MQEGKSTSEVWVLEEQTGEPSSNRAAVRVHLPYKGPKMIGGGAVLALGMLAVCHPSVQKLHKFGHAPGRKVQVQKSGPWPRLGLVHCS